MFGEWVQQSSGPCRAISASDAPWRYYDGRHEVGVPDVVEASSVLWEVHLFGESRRSRLVSPQASCLAAQNRCKPMMANVFAAKSSSTKSRN
jgi:hypothetical protein